jgi:hypothetical protein
VRRNKEDRGGRRGRRAGGGERERLTLARERSEGEKGQRASLDKTRGD